jgi:hypothetical protein
MAGNTIRIRHTANYLQICEIDIRGYLDDSFQPELTEVIVPVGGSQRDALATYGVSKLYDGSDEGETSFAQDRCYHSLTPASPWVELYLDGRYKVTDVNVLNRGDCCPYRYNGLRILVCDGKQCEQCGLGDHGTTASWELAHCEPNLYGDRIRFEHTNEYIQLCEVQIKGVGAPLLPGYLTTGSHVVLPAGGAQKDQLALWDWTKMTDGNQDTNMNHNGCYHSGSGNAWVELYFDDAYTVTRVSFLNRGDVLGTRARYTRVLICNGPGREDCTECGMNEDVSLGEWLTVTCQLGAFGDTLRIETIDYMQICEIAIEGFPGTFEPQKLDILSGSASSEEESYPVEKVFDGIVRTELNALGCYHSAESNGDSIDLQIAPAIVNSVRILNRGDCCWERLLGAEVSVCEKFQTSCLSCGVINYAPAGDWIDMPCKLDSTLHTYLHIEAAADGDHYLQICEVEIYGVYLAELPDLPVKLPITGGSESSQLKSEWSYLKAYDENLSTDVEDNGCYHSAGTTNDWVMLDVDPAFITTVKLLNREDCCGDRLNGASVFVCEATNACRLCDNPIATVAGQPWVTVSCDIPGSSVKVQAASLGDHYLTICEAEIYGTTL